MNFLVRSHGGALCDGHNSTNLFEGFMVVPQCIQLGKDSSKDCILKL